MNNIKSIIFTAAILIFIPIFSCHAQVWNVDEGYQLHDSIIGNYSELYEELEILYDSSGTLTYNDIALEHAGFKKNTSGGGIHKDGIYWLKTTIQGSDSLNGRYLFSIGRNINVRIVDNWLYMASWPLIDIYIQSTDSLRKLKSGFKRRPSEKEIQNAYSYFWLYLKAGEQKTVYARLDPQEDRWIRYSIPDKISLNFHDPGSLNILDDIYRLRDLESDPPSKGGFPRLINISEIVQIYKDTTCSQSFEEVLNDWDENSHYFAGRLDMKACYWTHFKVTNPFDESQLRVFSPLKSWQRVEAYISKGAGSWDVVTFGNRESQKNLSLNIAPGDSLSLYFKYPSLDNAIAPTFFIWDIHEKDFLKLYSRTRIKFFLLGSLLLPILFFLIQYIIQRDRLTFYYLIFLVGSSMYLLSILDQAAYFWFTYMILKSSKYIVTFYSIGSLLSLVGLIKFIDLFLDIKSVKKLFLRIGDIILIVFSLIVIIFMADLYIFKNKIGFDYFFLQAYRLGGVILFTYALFLSIYGFIKRLRFSGALLLAFSPLLLTGILYAFVSFSVSLYWMYEVFDPNLLLVEGFILSIVLFGVVIGVRNNALKGEKIKMQSDMLSLQESVNKQLIKLDALKDQFLANTSHELRTPLQGIIGLSETMQEKENDLRKKQELAMITSSGKRLSSLVNSILDFSKLKTHELKLSVKAIDIRMIVDVVLHISQPLIKGKNIKMINKVDPSIPYVQADEDRLYQIMNNLIGNAIKFTNEGSIEVSAVEQEVKVLISIKDTGIGIPEDRIDDIFKSFEQVDAAITREHGGTGLGLTITKQLIELHGGKIWVKSIVDKGTTMHFTLPKSSGKPTTIEDHEVLSRVIDLSDTETVKGKQEEEASPDISGNKFNILIVDDESINQQVLSNHLSDSNFRILQAMNGSEALKIIENESLDLVLLDIMMPKMSGYEVCREIRKKHLASELPVIMITAKDQVTDLMEGLASGANDYLAKPFSKNELLARLKTHLNLYNITSAYLRFIPKELIKALGHESIIDVRLGDQARGEMSILFSDIRSFTTITEKLDAKESFEFLNNYLNCITPAITANNGFIDKYIGDAVMALFPYKTDDAVNAAIEAQKNLAEYNRERKKEGKMPIKIGIGLHTGPLMIGTIGVENRMDGTVISDAVNLASRLEELNKHYRTSMIISEETLNKLNNPENYHYRFLSKVSVKGRQQSNKIYEFFDGDSEHDLKMKTETLEMFNKGIEEYYRKQFSKGSVYFQQILDVYPEDRTAKIFLVNCAKYMVEGVPDDWDGVDIVEKVF
jgi:signal transduction histidine kinase/class 3 adenylate cyclase/ActR/RegA family two-component response regulator